MEEYSIKEWLNLFGNQSSFASEIVLLDAGWYDWFERGTSRRALFTKKCVNVLRRIQSSKYINDDKMYVFFAQPYSFSDGMYENLKICDKETGKVLFCISYEKKRWSVWNFTDINNNNPVKDKTLKEVYKFFNV